MFAAFMKKGHIVVVDGGTGNEKDTIYFFTCLKFLLDNY